MAKITPAMEKRHRRLEEKNNLSRVTRARTAKLNSSSPQNRIPSHLHSATTPKPKHSPSQTNKQSDKTTSTHSTDKQSNIKLNPKLPSTKSEYGNNDATPSVAKKSKYVYEDAVQKLENSTSVHTPKRLVLFVGNIPTDITEEQLMAHFTRAGASVKSVKLPRYRGTVTGRGYAYVEFSSTISHRIGLRLNNTTLAGRKIVVEFTSNGKMTEKQLLEKVKRNDDVIFKMPFDT